MSPRPAWVESSVPAPALSHSCFQLRKIKSAIFGFNWPTLERINQLGSATRLFVLRTHSTTAMKTISIITPCYNEELNVRELYERVRATVVSLGEGYVYEHIFID